MTCRQLRKFCELWSSWRHIKTDIADMTCIEPPIHLAVLDNDVDFLVRQCVVLRSRKSHVDIFPQKEQLATEVRTPSAGRLAFVADAHHLARLRDAKERNACADFCGSYGNPFVLIFGPVVDHICFRRCFCITGALCMTGLVSLIVSGIRSQTNLKKSALHMAIMKGADVECVKKLLEFQADPFEALEYQKTAFHRAAEAPNPAYMEILLQHVAKYPRSD
ncbi:hypothetical protein EVAR_47302_1 [Eumeta japonica]|uniref:Uncharacterized protein n=1 Tax=Eumeta variegata TaxID=151549 RepID=A0A4C1YGI2_EUMVA|nr:hypothetical protein EVAR_47302_1 [Eumeta japonica]